ncbi:hypothetical protein RRG08_061777 [Elysia crispata]|uniref:Uncharacterized protein n=1 Tax=Elysia crispata TaxID=231223 RepID=A0AAE1A9D6_9GAST|nr:hypothetical protein RRG08_061777 [Elysia crispata]
MVQWLSRLLKRTRRHPLSTAKDCSSYMSGSLYHILEIQDERALVPRSKIELRCIQRNAGKKSYLTAE